MHLMRISILNIDIPSGNSQPYRNLLTGFPRHVIYLLWALSKREGHHPQPCYFHGASSFCIVFSTCAHQVIDSDGIKAQAQWNRSYYSTTTSDTQSLGSRDDMPLAIVPQRHQ
jgi:hypothetical protein